MAQRLTSNGQKFGANFQINTIWGMNTMEPSVGVSKDGSFAVMWAAQITSNSYQVFAKLFDKFSNPLTSDLYINQPGVGVSSIGQGKHIGVDGKGNYCITWSSYNNSNRSNIYLQIIDKAGQFIGINTLVSDTSDVSDKIFPEIASTDNGYFLIDWQINGQSINSSGVGARIYSINNGYVTDNLKLITSTYSWNPCTVSSDQDSTFIILLLDNGYQYLQKISTSGEFKSDTVRVKYNSTNKFYSYTAALTNIINEHFFMASNAQQRNDANVYKQKFNINLEPEDLQLILQMILEVFYRKNHWYELIVEVM